VESSGYRNRGGGWMCCILSPTLQPTSTEWRSGSNQSRLADSEATDGRPAITDVACLSCFWHESFRSSIELPSPVVYRLPNNSCRLISVHYRALWRAGSGHSYRVPWSGSSRSGQLADTDMNSTPGAVNATWLSLYRAMLAQSAVMRQ